MEPIGAALAAIESLDPREKPNYTQIAQTCGVVRSTLTRGHQRVSASRSTKAQNQHALHPQQEQVLLPTQAMIRRFASDIAKRELRKGWDDRYILLPFGISFLESARFFLAGSSTMFYDLHFHSFDVMCLRIPHVYKLVYLLRGTINTVLICSC
jgi:hypothetical protein